MKQQQQRLAAGPQARLEVAPPDPPARLRARRVQWRQPVGEAHLLLPPPPLRMRGSGQRCQGYRPPWAAAMLECRQPRHLRHRWWGDHGPQPRQVVRRHARQDAVRPTAGHLALQQPRRRRRWRQQTALLSLHHLSTAPCVSLAPPRRHRCAPLSRCCPHHLHRCCHRQHAVPAAATQCPRLPPPPWRVSGGTLGGLQLGTRRGKCRTDGGRGAPCPPSVLPLLVVQRSSRLMLCKEVATQQPQEQASSSNPTP